MDAKRKTFQNMLSEKLRSNERMIEMLTRSIDNIQNTMSADKDVGYFENRVKSTEGSIAKYKGENAEISIKLGGVMTGSCDTEILKLYQDAKDDITKKKEIATKKSALILEKEEKDHARGKVYDEKERKVMRNDYHSRKNIDRDYNRFLEISENPPEYISRNLKTMPNNKGYKFRNITFYGELPCEPGPVVVFEKTHDGMYISETHPSCEFVYFKPRDGGQKELVRRVRLIKNFNAPATKIVEFCKS